MCQICSMNPLSYSSLKDGSSGTVSETGGFAAETPVFGGSGSNFRISQGATSNQNINGLLSGDRWGGSTLSYSFPTAANQYEAGYSEAGTFGEATAALRTATRYAMDLISQYTNLVTQEVAATSTADVRSAFSSAPGTAYAYLPSNAIQGGDIWYGRGYTEYQNPIRGQYAWATVIHEIGHAVGLKHGHEFDGVSNTAMQSAFDQMAYSIMTYRSYAGGPMDGYTNETNGYAQTFMMYDIAALQTMYGANFNTNSGNTTYSWSSTTGEMFINGVGQGAPGGNRIFLTIWDGNGTDTFDFSNYNNSLNIDLSPGGFSITSAIQRANLGEGNLAPGNIFNALQFNGDARSLIENANGGSADDRISGNSANNTLTGNGGNDVMLGMSGADTLRGGQGNDTLIGDGQVVWDGFGNSVYRLYLATLNRAPDEGGHRSWVDSLNSGSSLQQVATGFINSDEFRSVYGPLNNEQFVRLLYSNVLNRAPDAEGLSSWVTSLNSGASRESVVVGFSESGEFRVRADIREHAGEIYRLYDSAFNRSADAGGFQFWAEARYGGTNLTSIATSFMNSAEFVGNYGNLNSLTQTQFVTLLYNNVLDRAPDSGGLSAWVTALNNGALSRTDALIQFSNSAEHVSMMNTGLGTFMRTAMSAWTDTLVGGSGDDFLTGGRGADRFVFNASDTGTDRVYGFEVFDTLEFRGFGFNSAADVLANMSQQGSNVVFTSGSNSIIFQDTQLSVLQKVTSDGWIFA